MSHAQHDISSINKFKALWKGYRLRKHLLEVRNEFEKIFHNIHSNEHWEFSWKDRNYLSLPNFLLRDHTCDDDYVNTSELERKNINDTKISSDSNTSELLKANNIRSKNCIIASNKEVLEQKQNITNSEQISNVDFACQTTSSLEITEDQANKDTELKKHLIHRSSSPIIHDNLSVKSDDITCIEGHMTHSESHSEKDENDINIELKNSQSVNESVHKNDTIEKQKDKGMNRYNILTDSWLSDKSFTTQTPIKNDDLHTMSKKELLKCKEETLLELLWINQAINSRKSYLQMRTKQ